MPTTSTSASTRDAAGSSAATKAVDIASKVIEHTGSSVRVVHLPAGRGPRQLRAHARGRRASQALLDAAKPAIEFKLDPQIDRLRVGFDSPAAIARKAEALIREIDAARGMGPLARLRRRTAAGERRRPSE